MWFTIRKFHRLGKWIPNEVTETNIKYQSALKHSSFSSSLTQKKIIFMKITTSDEKKKDLLWESKKFKMACQTKKINLFDQIKKDSLLWLAGTRSNC